MIECFFDAAGNRYAIVKGENNKELKEEVKQLGREGYRKTGSAKEKGGKYIEIGFKKKKK